MNNITLSSQVSKILENAKLGASPEQRFITACKAVAYLENKSVDLDFHHSVSHLVDYMNYNLDQYPHAFKKYFYEKSLEIVNFIFTHKVEKSSFAHSPVFLSNLKRVFNAGDIKKLESEYKIKFDSKYVKNLYIEKEYFNNYVLIINKITSAKELNIIINDAINFLDVNNLQNNYVESLINKYPDVLGLNIKLNKGLKVSEKELQSAFAKIYESEINLSHKFILIDSFLEVFKLSNIFEKSIKPMNVTWLPIKKFLNIVYLKSMPEQLKVCDYIKNNKSILEANLDGKLDRYKKIAMFGKLILNIEETQVFIQQQNKKNKNESRKKKL